MVAFHGRPAYRHGHPARPYLGDDVGGHFHRLAHGAHLFFRVYERGEGFSALLRFPELVHLFDARLGGSHEHFPDVCVLGLVGVSSYLLIGFYYTKPEAISASKKAFIVTRFADLGFLIGILIYGYYMGTFTFAPAEENLMQGALMLPWALADVRGRCR